METGIRLQALRESPSPKNPSHIYHPSAIELQTLAEISRSPILAAQETEEENEMRMRLRLTQQRNAKKKEE